MFLLDGAALNISPLPAGTASGLVSRGCWKDTAGGRVSLPGSSAFVLASITHSRQLPGRWYVGDSVA